MKTKTSQLKHFDFREKNLLPDHRTTGLDFIRFMLPAHSGYKFEFREIPGMKIDRHYLYDPFMPGIMILREEETSLLRPSSTTMSVLGINDLDLTVASCTRRINRKTEITLNANYPYIRLPEHFDQGSSWSYCLAEGIEVVCHAKFIKRKELPCKTLVVNRKINGRMSIEYYIEGKGLKDILFGYNPLTD